MILTDTRPELHNAALSVPPLAVILLLRVYLTSTNS